MIGFFIYLSINSPARACARYVRAFRKPAPAAAISSVGEAEMGKALSARGVWVCVRHRSCVCVRRRISDHMAAFAAVTAPADHCFPPVLAGRNKSPFRSGSRLDPFQLLRRFLPNARKASSGRTAAACRSALRVACRSLPVNGFFSCCLQASSLPSPS